MAKAAPDDRANARTRDRARPYAPSWVDGFTALIDRLPGPSWLLYAGLGLVLLLLQAGVLWIEGVQPSDTFMTVHGTLTGIAVLMSRSSTTWMMRRRGHSRPSNRR